MAKKNKRNIKEKKIDRNNNGDELTAGGEALAEEQSEAAVLENEPSAITKEQPADDKSAKEKKRPAKTDQGFNPVAFFKGTKEELDKVVWPTRQQLISESVAVLLMVTLSASLIYLVDNFFNWAARQVFG